MKWNATVVGALGALLLWGCDLDVEGTPATDAQVPSDPGTSTPSDGPMDEPTTDGPTTDGPTTDDPGTDGPTMDGPMMDDGTPGADDGSDNPPDDMGGASDACDAENLVFDRLRVEDRTPAQGNDPGADVRAVLLYDSEGDFFVEEVLDSTVADTGEHADPDAVVGENLDTSGHQDQAGCDSDDSFVSLGGDGGMLVLAMAKAQIQQGDSITVYEVVGCPSEENDQVAVSVSVGTEQGCWVPATPTGDNADLGLSFYEVPELPNVAP